MLNLKDSTIVFRKPREDEYQTLNIGLKSPHVINNNTANKTVYNATGDAKIYLNLKWHEGAPKEQQKTDRLLIHGNVSGTTTIYFNSLLKDENTKEKNTGPVNTHGLSLVQVSGKADENSFKLAKGYTTIKGLPYKYTLNAYGPTSSRGKANIEQSLVGEEEDFWDFRLQNTYLNPEETTSLNLGETTPLDHVKTTSFDTEKTVPLSPEEATSLDTEETASLNPEAKIRALVPQVASYLVMPNAMFFTGFTDINSQNALLNNMQTTLFGAQSHKKVGSFCLPMAIRPYYLLAVIHYNMAMVLMFAMQLYKQGLHWQR